MLLRAEEVDVLMLAQAIFEAWVSSRGSILKLISFAVFSPQLKAGRNTDVG